VAGQRVTLTNRRTGASASAAMIEGGFDPVALEAQTPDTIFVDIHLLGGGTQQMWIIVPRTRRPNVVRTDPPPRKRDVPLNAALRVVFSEPIDPISVTTTTVTLQRSGETIAGSVAVLADEPWIAEFTPATPLTPETTYDLTVTSDVRDLDGETLESGLAITFTTVEATSVPPFNGRLAFSRWDGSAARIYTMNADGSGLVSLADGLDPSFSPDGTKLAFWRWDSDSGTVFIVNADGSNLESVARGYQPTWSPDGRRLAYGCGGICLVNVDGTGVTRLTPAAPLSADQQVCIRDTDPAWSPNGTTIAFTRWPDSHIPTSECLPLGAATLFPFDFWTEIRLVEVDGSNLRSLRDNTGLAVTYAGWPAWSPDGRRLAFYFANVEEERIDVADADGLILFTAVRRSPPVWGNVLGSPDWSPDGSQLVFSTAYGWGFADATGAGANLLVTAPFGFLPYSLTWSWSRR
jgi:TolB protein